MLVTEIIKSKCWLYQHMAKSMHSPMFTPLPFTKADYKHFNWNDLASRLEEGADDRYTPNYPMDNSRFSEFESVAQFVT